MWAGMLVSGEKFKAYPIAKLINLSINSQNVPRVAQQPFSVFSGVWLSCTHLLVGGDHSGTNVVFGSLGMGVHG